MAEESWDDLFAPVTEEEQPEQPKQQVEKSKQEIKIETSTVPTPTVASKSEDIDSLFDDAPVQEVPKPEPPAQRNEASQEIDFLGQGVETESVSVPNVQPKVATTTSSPTVPSFQTMTPTSEFSTDEAEPLPIEVITIFGDKGVGKTKSAFGMKGTIACLSFDKQSAAIKSLFYHNDKRIRVWDAIRYLDETSPIAVGESNDKTFRYVMYILDQIKAAGGADWIVLDGSELINQICEQVMRTRNSLMPTQGVTNRNLWKERNMYVRQIHRKSVDCARKGVIYTTYVENKNIFKDGEISTTEKHPRWIDITLRETSVVIYIESVMEKNTRKFYASIVSSKSPKFKTGERYDITGKELSDVLGID
jgi:hypothetical protein